MRTSVLFLWLCSFSGVSLADTAIVGSTVAINASGSKPMEGTFLPHDMGLPRALELPVRKVGVGPAKPSALAMIGTGRVEELAAASVAARTMSWRPVGHGYVAEITVRSPGAAALRVALESTAFLPMEVRVGDSQAWAGAGSALVVPSDLFQAMRRDVEGPFWTPITPGEAQVIQLRVIGDASPSEVRVTNVSHLDVDPAAAPGARPREKLLSCEQNYSCSTNATVLDAGKAVARVAYSDGQGGTFLCSGSLLNDRSSSGTPWFATAAHCEIDTQAIASTLQFYWHYEVPCGGTTLVPAATTTTGAQLLLWDSAIDFNLLKVTGPIPSGSVYLGWNPADLSLGATVFGVHHPTGAPKAVSFGTKTQETVVSFSEPGFTFSVSANTVDWSVGITEPGSSGSPLFGADGLFRGTLSAGPLNETCSTAIAYYSKFSNVYPKIRGWIDPVTSTTDDWPNGAAQVAVTQQSNSVVSGVLNSSSDQDWFGFAFPVPGVWIVYSQVPVGSSTDPFGRIYFSDGVTVFASNDTDPTGLAGGKNFLMAAHVTQARSTAFVQVTGSGGSTGPYILNSIFVVDDDHSDFYTLGTPLAPNATDTGTISPAGDADYFIIDVTTAGTLTIESSGATDLVGRLYDANNNLVAINDDISFPTNLNFRVTASVVPGRYYMGVFGYDPVITTGSYSIRSTFTASGQSSNFTGLWWNPQESGWGINLNHQSDIIFATLFTYATDSNPLWLVGPDLVKQADGSFNGTLYITTGPPFYQVPWSAITATAAGTMSLRFSGSSSATLTYTYNGATVVKTIQPQLFSTPATCISTSGSRAAATNYTDLWWNPAESGWGINLTHQGSIIFGALFTYQPSGRDGWLVAPDMGRQADGSFTGGLYATTGPQFNTSPWTSINAAQVGTMTLRFSTGDTGQLVYSVEGTNVTKNIIRQVFGTTLPLCQ